jgi:hypothetical protein
MITICLRSAYAAFGLTAFFSPYRKGIANEPAPITIGLAARDLDCIL